MGGGCSACVFVCVNVCLLLYVYTDVVSVCVSMCVQVCMCVCVCVYVSASVFKLIVDCFCFPQSHCCQGHKHNNHHLQTVLM